MKTDQKRDWQLINKLDKSNNNGLKEKLIITEFTHFFKHLDSVTSKLKNDSQHENIFKILVCF